MLIYPVTDVGSKSPSYTGFADGYMLTRESMRWFTAHYLSKPADGADWRVSPLRAPSLTGLPPALVITAASIRCATRAPPMPPGCARPVSPWTMSPSVGWFTDS